MAELLKSDYPKVDICPSLATRELSILSVLCMLTLVSYRWRLIRLGVTENLIEFCDDRSIQKVASVGANVVACLYFSHCMTQFAQTSGSLMLQ